MIIDYLPNAARYTSLHPLFAQAFDFLRTQKLDELPARRHDIVGDQLFALVQRYDAKPHSEGFWESHRRYIDLQYIHAGREQIGWAPLSAMRLREHDEARDLLFLDGQGELLTVNAGGFMLLWPEDAHMPGLRVGEAAEPVFKVVFKIAV